MSQTKPSNADDLAYVPLVDGMLVFRPSTAEIVRLRSDRWARAHALHTLPDDMQATLADAEALVSRRELVALPDPNPQVAQLNVAPTNFCNMGCTYCYNELPIKDRKGSETEAGMTVEVARQMVDALVAQSGEASSLTLAFIGGEALIERRVLFETVAYARSLEQSTGKSFSFTVYTNGLLVNDEVIDWANENCIGITFSLDGPPLENDRFRVLNSGRGTARRVLEQMKRFLTRYAYPVRTVTAVVSTKGAMAPTAQYLHDLGFNSIQIQAAYDTAGYAESAELDDMAELARWYRDSLLAGDVFKIDLFTDPMVSLAARGGATKTWYPSNAGHRALGVGEDGRLYPCHHFFGEDAAALGHIRDGLPSGDARRDLYHRVDQRKPCASCWARHACGGECYHRALTSGVGYRGVVETECGRRKTRIGFAMGLFVNLLNQSPVTLQRIMHDQLDVRTPVDEVYAIDNVAAYRRYRQRAQQRE